MTIMLLFLLSGIANLAKKKKLANTITTWAMFASVMTQVLAQQDDQFCHLLQLQKYYKRGGAIKTWGIRNEIITLQKKELRPMNDFGSRRKK